MKCDQKQFFILIFTLIAISAPAMVDAQSEPAEITKPALIADPAVTPGTPPDPVQSTQPLPPLGPTTIDLPRNGTLGVYIKVTDSCNHAFGGACLNVRSGPSTSHDKVRKLRINEVLMIDQIVIDNGMKWYRINYDDQHLSYPERVKGDEYVAADYVEIFSTKRTTTTWEDGGVIGGGKKIVVDISDQSLTAYENDSLFMKTSVSTGKELSPSDVGSHEIFKKMASRYMQGPIPNTDFTDVYDLEGVPWTMYFDANGSAIHGAYWHNSFGSPYSHGCINLRPDDAQKLYDWSYLGTKVIIQD